MLNRRLHCLVPTLLVIGAMPLSAMAATAPVAVVPSTERDAQYDAVKSLIDRDYRLPAKRQLADFIAAGHKGAEWQNKFLTWSFADRFRISSPDAAEKAALAKEAAGLQAEFEAAAKASQLPAEMARQFTGSGRILRLVNDILKDVNPDMPAPLVKETAIPQERRDALNEAVKALIVSAGAAYDAGLAKIAANAAAEQAVENLDDKDPKRLAVLRPAVDLRFEAIHPMYLAHKALREIAERGADFGVDPAPAREFIDSWTQKNFKGIVDLDYFWGEYNVNLRALCTALAAEGARIKMKEANIEELEGNFLKVAQMNIAEDFKGAPVAVLDELRTLQVRTWADLIIWYRDMGKAIGPRQWQRGAEIFLIFKDQAKTDANLRLDQKDRTRQVEVARVYLAAARLLKAKGDTAGATAATSAISAVRNHPMGYFASQWMGSFTREGVKSGSGWVDAVVAGDPTEAITTASAFMRAANQDSDPARARATMFTAATVLRNATLGLRQEAFADRADEVAPEVWYRYASVKSKLDLKWHAAIVAQTGLRHLQTRMTELKNRTPWKTPDGKQWTECGRYVSLLAQNAIVYGSYLQSVGKGPGAVNLYQDIVGLVQKVSPDDYGKNTEWVSVVLSIQSREWSNAEAGLKNYQKKFPEDGYKCDGAMDRIRLGQISDSKSPEERKTKTAQLLKEAEVRTAKIHADLEKEKDPVRRRDLMRAERDVFALKARVCVQESRFEETIQMLGPDYWKVQPDEDVAVEMLGLLCSAIHGKHKAISTDQKLLTDPKLLVESWPAVAFAFEVWQKQHERLPGQSERIESQGKKLSWVFNLISVQVAAMRDAAGASPQLADIAKEANRGFAGVMEPIVNEKSVPDIVLKVANVLWELDQHVKAARLYGIYLDQLIVDPDLATLRDTPKTALDPLDPILMARPELKAKWLLVRDLFEDNPELKKKILELDLPEKEWGEKKRDFALAAEAIISLKEDAAKSKMSIGAGYAALDTGLTKLLNLAKQLTRQISVTAKLASAYREQGDKKKANALYEKLIDYDPTNPDFLAATVELTIDRLQVGEPLTDKELEAAQIKTARVRTNATNNSTLWTARIQLLELMVYRKQYSEVKSNLKFAAVDKSTPFDELQQLPREKRDDKTVRRAANALAVDLCKRYSAIFTQPGVDMKPAYAIDTVTIDGKPVAVFVPVGGPKFTAVSREIGDDGTKVWFLWEEGKEPPPEPEVKPEPTPVPEVKAPDAKASDPKTTEPAKSPAPTKPPEAKP